MEFEFDPVKSASNEIKHGLDFAEAQALWDGKVLESSTLSLAEPRKLVIGKIEEKHWTAVVTERDGKVRIISVRRSRNKEIEIYENSKDHKS